MRGSLVSRLSLVVGMFALAGVVAAFASNGGSMFSPGDLRGADSTPTVLGGVTSHAELSGRCGSCHARPLSARPMNARCLSCHSDIRTAIADSTSLHGSVTDVHRCTICHTEHAGASAPNASLERFRGVHGRLGSGTFPLDGAHAKTKCNACHRRAGDRAGYANAPKSCIGCHQEKDKHRGQFGADCGACHNTSTWGGASFAHEAFPVNHGTRGTNACKVCHENPNNYKQYTCYNCHAHSPARVKAQHREEVGTENLDDCVRCHRGGRSEGREHGEGRERGESGERR